jgi:3-deoxy-D-manno-octulosonic-acid transferase
MYLLYNSILCLATILLLPVFILLLLINRRYRDGLFQKLGFISWKDVAVSSARRPIWVHAVSVGEVMTALPLIRELKHVFPQLPILLSTATATGRAIAERSAQNIERIIFYPFDYPWCVRLFISRLRPLAFIALETELWPNFLRALSVRSIPAVIVSGRISSRSFPRYRKFRFFFSRVLENIACFCMQSAADAQRITALGAAPAAVRVTGNIKFDLAPPDAALAQQEQLCRELGLKQEQLVFIAGSTHPGEEEMLLEVFCELKKEFPELVLILAPRHPGRFDEVASLMQERGMPYVRKTALAAGTAAPGDVILLDTIGELAALYCIATLVFIGGSLVPVGGHNLLEAAVCKKPVLFGPHMDSCPEIAAALQQSGGGILVADSQGLREQSRLLLADPGRRDAAGARAYQVIAENSGALQKTIEILQAIIERQAARSGSVSHSP